MIFPDTAGLGDEAIRLRLTGTAEAKPEKQYLPACYFDICRYDGTRVGTCDLRIGHNEKTEIGGNIGYTVFPPYRGHRYAARAVELLKTLAVRCGMTELTISCVPENLASARTCELAGGALTGTVPVPEWSEMYQEGKRFVKVYRFDLTAPAEPTLRLVLPGPEYLAEIAAYRQEYLETGESMDGTGPLRRIEDPAAWLAQVRVYEDPERRRQGKALAVQFLCLRGARVVGMLQLRQGPSDYFDRYAGYVGYSVRPSERRKGYAKWMLRAILPTWRSLPGTTLTVSCLPENEASRRVIRACGGQYLETVYVPDDQVWLERYRIEE